MVLADSKNKVGLGRALMNSRGGVRSGGTRGSGRGRHSKGPIEAKFKNPEKKEADWYGIRSITEQNDLDEFLATAELADTDFTAEKLNNVRVIHKDQYNPYLLTAAQEKSTLLAHRQHTAHLTVPRRPKWDASTTPAELDRNEKDAFLDWRRGLAELQETKDLLMTPFERNLEVWRQLWRVIERSDLVVQIVDARNPLMFRCNDLERYVKEVDPRKENLLLVNKADMMTLRQRRAWAEYFKREGVKYKFFSAALAKASNEYESDEEGEEVVEGKAAEAGSELAGKTEDLHLAEEGAEDEFEDVEDEDEDDPSVRIITVDELESLFLEHAPEVPNDDASSSPRKTTIGLVGYPNVGKSSTINALLGAKKVSVSSTPGKTKHFQTLHLSPAIILCDCPGLVFPNFATTKAELVCNGILPIDQQREYTGPAALVAQRIPQHFLERVYGLKIRTRPLEEGGTGVPTGEELLVSYAKARGFMKTGGSGADDSRAARYVLKDYINGKLRFCFPPPEEPPIDAAEFNAELYEDDSAHLHDHHPSLALDDAASVLSDPASTTTSSSSAAAAAVVVPEGRKSSALDKQFFRAHAKAGNAGHMTNPFPRGARVPVDRALDGGRMLSGRKAKAMFALEMGIGREELEEVAGGGGKKHFKGGSGGKQRRKREKEPED